jgi:hypothetical protein
MDLRRVRTWEWLTGLAGLVLLVSLFLPWYSAGSASVNAWESFAVNDVILALAALAAMALPVVAAVQRTTPVVQAMANLMVWLALVAAVVAVVRLLDPPGRDATRDIGAWLGTAAALAIFVFNWRSMRDKRFPRAMRPPLHVETLATPAPDGTRRDST